MTNEGFQEKSDQIRQLASLPPERFSEHLANLHNTLDASAPNIATHIYASANNAVQFLNSKLPKMGNELIQDKLPELSELSKNKWLKTYHAVNDPLSVLDHVDKGTLTHEHVEALRSVYPELHQDMSNQILEHLGKMKMNGKQLPSSKKLAISKFLGMPIDSSLTPQSLQAIINANAGAQKPMQPKAPQKASNAELSQINKVNPIYRTGPQQLQFDRSQK